jgi:hypothetical protein
MEVDKILNSNVPRRGYIFLLNHFCYCDDHKILIIGNMWEYAMFNGTLIYKGIKQVSK